MSRFKILFIVLIAIAIHCGKKGDQAHVGPALKAAVTFVQGTVSQESEGQLSAARIGAVLQPGDLIITGADSAAELMVQNMGLLKVGSDSRIRIQNLFAGDGNSEAEIKLERGDLSSVVRRQNPNDRYTVITPTAIAGVRGTSFVTSVERLPAGATNSPAVSLSVLEGSVAVQMPGQEEVILGQNTELKIRGFQKLSRDMIQPLSPAALESLKNMAVFHKTDVLEFRSLMADLQKSSSQMRLLESDQTLEGAMDDRTRKQAGLADDSVQKAKRVNESRFIKRDTEGDPVKMQPSSSFKQ